VKAFLLACLAVAASVGIALLARPLLVVAWHTVYVAVAWPAQATVSAYETTRHGHWLTTTQRKGWHIIGWTRWMLPAWRERNYHTVQAATQQATLVRWGMLTEVAAVVLVVALPLLRKLWGPLWFVVGRAGKLTPGTAHGTARWADRRDARHWRPRRGAGSFVLGRVVGSGGLLRRGRVIALPNALVYIHALLVGRSGSGKSTLIIGILLREIDRRTPRSLVLVDPKGELFERTSAALSKTHRVLRLNFYDPIGCGWNPLALIGDDPARALNFAQNWMNNTRRVDSSEGGFWNDTVLLLIQACALHLNAVNQPGTLSQLAHYLSRTDVKAMHRELLESPDPNARDAAQGFLTHLKADPTLAEKVLTGLPLRFMGLKGDAIQAVTDHNDLDFVGMGRRDERPVALYIQLTPGREDTLRPFVATLFGQMWDAQIAFANTCPGKALPRAVLNIIDEAGTIGTVGGLLHALNRNRSARIGILLAFQSPTQMVEQYGPDAPAAFEDGCNTLLFFAGAGPTTAQWMSDTLGTRTVVSASAGASRERERVFTQGGSRSKSETGAPLIGADELRALPKGTLIVSAANERPFMVRVIRWDKTRLRRRAGCMTSPTHSNKRTTAALVAPVAAAMTAPPPLMEETPAHGGDEAAVAVIAAPTLTATTPSRTKAPAKGRKRTVAVIDEDPFALASGDE